MRRAIIIIAGFFSVLLCGGWGFMGHKTIAQLSVYQLPKTMRAFYYRNIDSIVAWSVNPDIRRNTDSLEAPRHFIDIENFGDSAAWKMPRHWKGALEKYSLDTLRKYGYLPYHIQNMKQLLAGAFEQRNADSIIFYSAELAHYIGDANVPLHSTENYDGQLTNQKGIHSLWESAGLSALMGSLNLNGNHKAKYLKDPTSVIWETIRHANELVPAVLDTEKTVSMRFTASTKFETVNRRGKTYTNYSPAFTKAYGEKMKDIIQTQLLRSADLISDMWYTCWVDGGCPDLRELLQPSFNKDEKRKLKQECRSYHRNQLVHDSLLRSLKIKTRE